MAIASFSGGCPAAHSLKTTTVKKNVRKAGSTTKLEDVREEIRRAILSRTSIGEFHDTLNGAIGRDELAPHPLTGLRFRKIVRTVIQERKSNALKRRGTKERKTHP